MNNILIVCDVHQHQTLKYGERTLLLADESDEIVQSDLTECCLVSDRSPANSGGQPCKKHELYVSFSDLGWKVRTHARLNHG